MGYTRLPIEVVYQLFHEYREQAYLHAHEVRNEQDLKEYYRLIAMAIKCLEYAKEQFALSMDEDYQITMELIDILVKETHNLDLAEQYLSSLKERLKNHQDAASTGTLFRQRMHCEFLSLYVMPLRRDLKFHFKIASRNCDALLQYFDNVGTASVNAWRQVFEYVKVCLNVKLGKRSKARSDFLKLDNANVGEQWGAFITLSHVSFLLSRRYTISPETCKKLDYIDVNQVGPQLYSWKMVLQLYIQVFEDKNITDNLNRFKQFFAEYKGFMLDNDGICDVNVDEELTLRLSLVSVFRYRDLKNVLLLLQSVSFLVNCHDKKANFSTKFLPKVQGTVIKLIESNKQNGGKSLSSYDNDRSLYEHILSCVDFYQKWESFILSSEIKPLNRDSAAGNVIELLYSPLLEAMKQQVAGSNEAVNSYGTIIHSKQVNEVKIIAMVNSFIIRASRMSKNIQREENMAHCNSLWAEINHLLRESDLWKNQMWGCTMTILWLLSHLEPFTSSPMPSTDEERSKFLALLKNYYMVNKVIKEDNQEPSNSNLKIKKSVLLQILLNYLGGRLLEQDLATICQVSGLCFKLSRQLNSIYLQYVIGIWHLLNSTVAMNSKEVTIVRSKLEAIVRHLMGK